MFRGVDGISEVKRGGVSGEGGILLAVASWEVVGW